MSESNSESPKPGMVCCIGDIHGFITKLRNLWSNLETHIDPSQFRTATIIFLGDYCDRGPHTREVIDFLIDLPSRYPHQRHVFLSGNHDLAFSAFVGVLPPPPDGSRFSDGWKEYEASEEREGWFKGDGYEKMHLQGRRWGGTIKVKVNAAKGTEYQGSIYDAGPTFESYGVPHGSADLVKAVPDAHKKFLADLVWVHEEDNVFVNTNDGVKHCKLIAVHAGLEKGVDVKEQLKMLKARDTRVSKVQALSGRQTVWDIPEELTASPTIIVSGHHGKLHVEGLRLIIDEGGGYEHKPVAAIVLPSMKIIRDTDALQNSEDLTTKYENMYNDKKATSSGDREVEDEQASVLSSLVVVIANAHAKNSSVSADRKVKIEREEVTHLALGRKFMKLIHFC